jgi:hypothetical protein
MDAATVGITQKEDQEEGIDEQDIFDRVVLSLVAITVRLCSRVLGADDASLGAVMGKRGDAGAVVRGTGSSSRGATTDAASASETPSCCARAVKECAGASPRVRNAASSGGRSM